MKNLFARLQEPSTHAALASLAGIASSVAVANGMDPHTVGAVGTFAASAFALLGVFLKEGQ